MAANPRYNFSIHAKAKVGRLIGLAFLTGYFAGDATALAFAAWLNSTALANYAKVSCSKVLLDIAADDWEIPTTHTITDIKTFKALMGVTTDDNVKRSLTIPGLKPDLADADIVSALNAAQFTNSADPPVTFNKVVTYTPSFSNVIQGGQA